MKKKILSTVIGLLAVSITATTYAADANIKSSSTETAAEKASKHFAKQFKNEEAATMYPAENGYILRSQANGIQITSAYDKKGNWVYTIERYPADNLMKSIVDIVKNSYNDYYIAGMEKVEQPGQNTVYVVHLEDCNTFKTLRVSQGETELVQDIRKA